ncbi:MAG: poly-gamma-glutamate system protein, partial [Desulfobacterales bacterium]
MKGIYWRPSRVPRSVLVIIAILAVLAMVSVEVFRVEKKQPYYEEKIEAARQMKKAMETLREYRVKHVQPVDHEADPTGSGMIGTAHSPITSVSGYLEAKRTTINPNWAAVMVHLYKKAGVKKGDVVAMGFSGSFPAINLAAICAAETLGLNIIAVSSITASTWGANIPEFTWLDMERLLVEKGVISTRSAAVSLGGNEDDILIQSSKNRQLIENIIDRNRVPYISLDNRTDNIDARMSLYREMSAGNFAAVYVNIGGSSISAGNRIGKSRYLSGLNKKVRASALKFDSVMTRFARKDVPIIHMTNINILAELYGLPVSPSKLPNVGEGEMFFGMSYNRTLAAFCIVMLVFILYLF